MKVLFLTHIANRYGANRSLFELINALKPLGVNPHVVVPKEDSFCESLLQASIPFSVCPVSWWMTPKSEKSKLSVEEYESSPPLSRELLSITEEFNPDLIHTNSSVIADGHSLSQKLSKPHIWHVREMGEKDYDLHFVLERERALDILFSSEAVLFNSEATRRELCEKDDKKNARVIYNPIALPKEFTKESPQPTPQLTSIGHMSPFKGHHAAIKALSAVRANGINATLSIIGGGETPYLSQCKELVRELELKEHVTFTGHVSEPWASLASSSLVLQCSENEAFGRVTVEAMLAGVPVIGRNSGGTPEIILVGETGFLFNSDEELPSIIHRVLTEEDITPIIEQARETAEKRFSPDVIAKEVKGIYESVL